MIFEFKNFWWSVLQQICKLLKHNELLYTSILQLLLSFTTHSCVKVVHVKVHLVKFSFT